MLKFGVQLRPSSFSETVKQSKLCEDLGFDSIWCADRFIGGPPTTIWTELCATLGTMCSATSHIVVGSAASDCLRRHPATIAQVFASLSHTGSRKAVLGIGAGEAINLEPFGIRTDHLYTRLREAIIVIRKLWSASHLAPANFSGKHYSLNNAFLQTGVTTFAAPIYVASFQPRMLSLTGELGDGWIPFSVTPYSYHLLLNGPIKKSLELGRRSLTDFEPALVPITMVSIRGEDAQRQVLEPSRRYLVLLPSVLKTLMPNFVHPGKDYTLSYWRGALSENQRENLRETASRIPEDIALDTTISGTPEDCIEQISRFAEAGCRHFIFGVRNEDSIRLLARSVLPYFRQEEKD